MPARRVKTLFRNPLEQNHREHRSKRGRQRNYNWQKIKRKREHNILEKRLKHWDRDLKKYARL